MDEGAQNGEQPIPKKAKWHYNNYRANEMRRLQTAGAGSSNRSERVIYENGVVKKFHGYRIKSGNTQ